MNYNSKTQESHLQLDTN